MSTADHIRIVNEQDEATDVLADKLNQDLAINGFTVNPITKARKDLLLHGHKVVIELEDERMKAYVHIGGFPLPDGVQGFGENGRCVSAWVYVIDGDRQTAHDHAMRWADQVAFRAMLDNAASSALDGKPLVIESDVTTELGNHCVTAKLERDWNPDGEGGIIEELYVREGCYAVDVTELVKTGWLVTDHEDTDTTTVIRCDSKPGEHEIRVRVEYVMSFKHGDRMLALYDVSEVI